MAITTKAERKRRRESALAKISDGHGFADTVTYVMSELRGAAAQPQDETCTGLTVSFNWAWMRTMFSTWPPISAPAFKASASKQKGTSNTVHRLALCTCSTTSC